MLKSVDIDLKIIELHVRHDMGNLPVSTESFLLLKMSKLEKFNGLKLGIGGSLIFLLDIECPSRVKTFIVSWSFSARTSLSVAGLTCTIWTF
jgi:hypothetical protein